MPDEANTSSRPTPKRLSSWKDIANYVGLKTGKTQTIRTLQRWRTDQGLPIFKQGSSVYAYADQLDEWLIRASTEPEEPRGGSSGSEEPFTQLSSSQAPDSGTADEGTVGAEGQTSAPVVVAQEPIAVQLTPVESLCPPSPIIRNPKKPAWRLAIPVLSLAAILLAALVWMRPHGRTTPDALWGRLLVGATSEGRVPARIVIANPAELLAMTPEGDQVFAASHVSTVLSVVQTSTGTMNKIALSSPVRSMAMSPDGKRLYLGSRVDGVTILDTSTRQVLSRFPTHGEVFDMAVTPDGRRLFLAMSYQGLWRMRTDTGELAQVSRLECPMFLQSGFGKLFVSYQCGGPTGRRGHDAVEILDLQTEKHLATISGPPMVGGPLALFPDGGTLIIDGQDACQAIQYSHVDCPQFPVWISHFLRLSDLKLIRSLTLPVGPLLSGFIDRDHTLLVGDRLRVLDAYRYSETEEWTGNAGYLSGAAIDPHHRRVYVGDSVADEIVTLQAEASACAPPNSGLVAFYPGDGVPSDLMGRDPLTLRGDVQFAPGRVGQAFVLDGKTGYLAGPGTSHDPFGYGDSSLVLYVKFAVLDNEMSLFDRTLGGRSEIARLTKASDHRLVVDFGKSTNPVHLRSMTVVTGNRWYQVAVTKNKTEIALYVDGKLEDRHVFSSEQVDIGSTDGFVVGELKDQRHYLNGKVDEILLYNRALTPVEVRTIYQMREAGACRL